MILSKSHLGKILTTTIIDDLVPLLTWDMDGQIFFIDEYLFYMWMIYPDRITGYQENYPNKLFIELDRYGGNIKITDVEAKPKKTIANFQMECGQKSKIF